MALYVKSPNIGERQRLEHLRSSQESPELAKRASIVLLSNQKRRIHEISSTVGLHPINVRKWIHRFNEMGLDGLRSGKSPGRPPVFTEEQRAEIVKIARTNPRALGLHYSRWSLQRLRRYLIEHKVVDHISVETIRQIIQSHEAAHPRRERQLT